MLFNTDQPGHTPTPSSELVPLRTDNPSYDRIMALQAQYAQCQLIIKALARMRVQATNHEILNLTLFNTADPIECSLMITSLTEIGSVIDLLSVRYKTRLAEAYRALTQYGTTPT